MKYFALLTSLALLVGTGLGYRHGKGIAQGQFMEACTSTSMTVIYDQGDDAHRHFHCFELKELGESGQAESPPRELPADVLVL